MNAGIIYVVWGDTIRPLLERSLASLRRHHPELPFEVIEGDPSKGLLNKPELIRPRWDVTLFLDADTVLMGKLDAAFEAAERHGLACCIGECPWTRRYGNHHGDGIEYNTGVLFFSEAASPVLTRWRELAPFSPPSRFTQGGTVCGLAADDQWAFSKAVADTGFNPFVLPINYNFRPGWFTRFFLPLKVWHNERPAPEGLEERSLRAERGLDPISFCGLGADQPQAE